MFSRTLVPSTSSPYIPRFDSCLLCDSLNPWWAGVATKAGEETWFEEEEDEATARSLDLPRLTLSMIPEASEAFGVLFATVCKQKKSKSSTATGIRTPNSPNGFFLRQKNQFAAEHCSFLKLKFSSKEESASPSSATQLRSSNCNLSSDMHLPPHSNSLYHIPTQWNQTKSNQIKPNQIKSKS